MRKYVDYDKALLLAITNGKNTLNALEKDQPLAKLGEPLLTKDRWGSNIPNFRLIDRRLQALRKAGSIRFEKGVWEVIVK